MGKWDRRKFLSSLFPGCFSLGLFKTFKDGLDKPESGGDAESELRITKYNTLGITGLKVSDVGCGAMSLFNPSVLKYAYDLGVNFFDTAEDYLRTKSESFIGEALKDVRDRVIITTKHHLDHPNQRTRNAIIERVNASLKRLQTDYIDIAMIHGIDDLTLLDSEEVRMAYSQLKKDGKVRFTGFSTHNAGLTLAQALDSDFPEVILFIYSHQEGKKYESLIERVYKKGIGTIAMKSLAGGKQGSLKGLLSRNVSYPQAAIRWVLSNPHINCCLTTMASYAHVEEYSAASGKSITIHDGNMIAKYQDQADHHYCRVSCTECLSSCPDGVAINDILRFMMYFEDYGMEKEAIRLYSELGERKRSHNCDNCPGFCLSACPHNLDVKRMLIRSHEALSL